MKLHGTFGSTMICLRPHSSLGQGGPVWWWSLCLSVSLCVSVSLCLSLSLSLPLCLSLSLSLHVSVSPSPCLSLPLSVSPSPCLSITLPLPLSVSLPLSASLALSLSLSLSAKDSSCDYPAFKMRSHIHDTKFHSISDVTSSLFPETSNIIYNLTLVCVCLVLTCKSQKKERYLPLPFHLLRMENR